jgi:hypothetical protein
VVAAPAGTRDLSPPPAIGARAATTLVLAAGSLEANTMGKQRGSLVLRLC